MRSKIAIVGACLALVAAVAWMARRSYRKLSENLPERIVCRDLKDAQRRAFNDVIEHGGGAYPVLGTGSMVPFIPAAKPGEDPKKTIVAYAVLQADSSFEMVREGDLLVYAPEWANHYCYIHVAALETRDGFIMSGLNNNRSESWARVRAKNFKGIVARVYVWE